ncbi:MAG: dihydrofolate reductase [Saprospiraceae bacterium]|nr:dihydrofolate reductase [Saprospiraceae bacterium]
MIVSAIVAVSKNNVIGRDNDIPWHLSGDMKFFKRTTIDHHVIMGRKTFRSMKRPLPKRTNIVITRDPYFIASGCLIARSVEEALEIAYDNEETEAFIIGGGEIYALSLSYWDKIYLTEVNVEIPDGEVFFPKLDLKEWRLLSSEKHLADEQNDHDYTIKILERKVKS